MLVRTRPLDHSIDRMFGQLTRSFFAPARRSSLPTIDAAWTDGSLVLTIDLPGTPADAVDVSVSSRTLTIKAGNWERSLRLGAALDAEQVAAHYVDGRLTVTVAPVPAAEPRRIEVSTVAPEAPAIESVDADKAQAEKGTSDNG